MKKYQRNSRKRDKQKHSPPDRLGDSSCIATSPNRTGLVFDVKTKIRGRKY
jgi:hypothetical protein